jgi:endo-alpha-1,4-polygalactosaminidase (GH114 family)
VHQAPAIPQQLAPFEIAVVDGSGYRGVRGSIPTAAAVARAGRGGRVCMLAFLSIGTLHPDRPYAAGISTGSRLGPVRGRTRERHMDLRAADVRRALLEEVDRIAAVGFDGVCVGGLEAVHALSGGRVAAIRLINAIARNPAELRVVAWNGLDVARASLDAIAQENVFLHSEPLRRRALVGRLRRFVRDDGPVLVAEYAPPGSRASAEAVRQARAEGFRPAVTVRSLDRLPHAYAPRPGEPM